MADHSTRVFSIKLHYYDAYTILTMFNAKVPVTKPILLFLAALVGPQ